MLHNRRWNWPPLLHKGCPSPSSDQISLPKDPCTWGGQNGMISKSLWNAIWFWSIFYLKNTLLNILIDCFHFQEERSFANRCTLFVRFEQFQWSKTKNKKWKYNFSIDLFRWLWFHSLTLVAHRSPFEEFTYEYFEKYKKILSLKNIEKYYLWKV